MDGTASVLDLRINDAASRERDLVLDRAHLRRLTDGDPSLEREVLALFEQQTALLIPRIKTRGAAEVGALAHTLKGSALGVGAWSVAEAAQRLEEAVLHAEADLNGFVDALERATQQIRSRIAELLRAH